MIAAVYARKSTSQSDVADVEKSVTRQITLAKAFAAEKKWPVIETYIDDGVSGQESAKLVNRARMLADAVAGKFQMVIVRDFDRISRDDREGPAFVYMLQDAGVTVYEYVARSPIKVDRAMDRTMLNMKAGFAAHEAEAASARTREQKHAKAQRGAIADGRVLGYKNIGEAKQRQRVVDPDQAAIVVRIFELAAQGQGFLKIANTLNDAKTGVPNPTGQSRNGEPESAKRFWAATGIRAILHRRLYLGEIVYGQTKNARRGGKRIKVAGEHPVTIERPDLRIIEPELWDRAHRVLKKRSATYARLNNGKLLNKPESGGEAKYFLGGFVRCATCGGSMTSVKRTGKRGRPSLGYACKTRKARGVAACPVSHAVPMIALHEAVKLGLEELLTPERLDQVLQDLATEWTAQADAHAVQRAGLTADLTMVESELKNLAAALAGGASVTTVLDGIKEREGRRRDLRARLDALDAEGEAAGRVSRTEHLAALRRICKDWRTLLQADPAHGRRVLRDLRIERVVVRRDEDGAWSYQLRGALDKLIGGDKLFGGRFFEVPDRKGSAWDVEIEIPDAQVDQDSCPRGDSNTRHAV
jgi:site-specific DNA recombinase